MTTELTRRTWPITSLLALLGFLFVPAAITVLGVSQSSGSEGETASPALGGDLEVGDELDRSAYTEPAERGLGRIDNWVNDRVPGRELAFEFERTTTRVIDDNYNGAVAASDRVQLGQDGWLFLTDATDQPCTPAELEAEWMAEVVEIESLLAAAGKRAVIAIAPDRSVIASELLGNIANECEVENTAVVSRLADSPAVIDLSAVVAGEQHTLQLDSHWSPAGALAGSESIVEAVQPGTWEDREVVSDAVDRPGDLDKLVGYENTESVNLLALAQPQPTALERFETSLPGRPLVKATTPDAAELNVLVIHDSFGGYIAEADPTGYQSGSAIQYVRPWFSTVSNVRLGGVDAASIADPPVVEALADADVVVFLFVQRRLPFRFGTGMITGPLALALTGS